MSQLPEKPNFIIFMTDQQRSIQFFPPGWVEKYLPNYHTFLSKGAVFEQNICNSSPCGPSRASLFSGMFPANNGVTSNTGTITPDQMNFANVLNQANYDIHYMGKLHMRTDFTSFSTQWPTNLKTAAMSAFDQNKLLKEYYGIKSWTSPDFGTTLVKGLSLTQSQLSSLGGGYNGNDSRVVNGQGNVNLNTPTVMDIIQELEKQASEIPFCLVISLLNPHDISLFPQGWEQAGYPENFETLYELDSFELPASYADTLDEKPNLQAAYLNSECSGKLSKDLALKYLQFYAYLHIQSDNLLGEVMGKLSDNLLKDTILIRMADHGEMGMSHGGLQQKDCTMYNEMIKVPMIWMHESILPGKRHHYVSLIDLVPTLGTLAGVDLKKFGALQGKDYSAALLAKDSEFRDYSLFNYTYGVPQSGGAPKPALTPPTSALSTMYTLNPNAKPGTTVTNYPNTIYAYLDAQCKFGIYFDLDSNMYVQWDTAQFEMYSTLDTTEMQNLIPVAPSGTPYSAEQIATIREHYELLTHRMEESRIVLPLGWKAFHNFVHNPTIA